MTACAVVALAGIATAEQPATYDGLSWEYVAANGVPVVAQFPGVDRGTPCAVAANCQGAVGGAGYTGRSSDLVPLAAAPTADFGTADNFTLTSTQTITSVCFWGFYGNVNGSAPAAGAECFRLRFHANNTSGGVGHPDPAVLVGGEFVVGVSPRFGTVTPGTTLTRNSGTGITVTQWTATLDAGITLNPGCYWVEIVGNTSTVLANDRFRWGISDGPVNPNGSQDNAFAQKDNAIAWAANQVVGNAGDRAFCLNTALNPNSCGIPPVPPNATCATATTITAPFSVAGASTLFAFNQATPFCGANPVNGNTVWYRVLGDGSTFTARTCGAGTDFDTVINVYCRTVASCGTSNANLNCVANNDTGPASCTGTGANADPSEVTWASAPGVEYLIAVYGFQITSGFFDFSLTSIAGAAGPACASDRCSLTNGAVTPAEVDACGASTNSACNGAGVGTFTLGDDFRGTSYNLGTTRDFDFWECASAIPDSVGDGSAWLDVEYAVEFPGVFNFFTGACSGTSNGTFLDGAFANYLDGGPACPRATVAYQVQTPSGAPFRLNLLPIDFGGVPCASTFNDYTITVRLSTLGACCVSGQACVLSVPTACADQGGTFLAMATSCGPTDPCTAPVQGACCRGTTCALDTSANCPAQANQAYKGDNTACNAPGNNTMPCCKADFNQSGTVTVQDIFDFLAAYFVGNPIADINGGSVSVQDIFDFLAAYFAGCV